MPSFDDVREIGLALPETAERTSYGTPALFVRDKLFARRHQDGVSLVVFVDLGEREALVAEDPATFVVTPHYRDHEMMLVVLERVDRQELAEIVTESWRRRAPTRILEAYDAAHPPADGLP